MAENPPPPLNAFLNSDDASDEFDSSLRRKEGRKKEGERINFSLELWKVNVRGVSPLRPLKKRLPRG